MKKIVVRKSANRLTFLPAFSIPANNLCRFGPVVMALIIALIGLILVQTTQAMIPIEPSAPALAPGEQTVANLSGPTSYFIDSAYSDLNNAPTRLTVGNVITLTASADAFIDSGTPDTKYGTSTALAVTLGPAAIRNTLLRFDLSTNLPPDAIVDQARLELYVSGASGTDPVNIRAAQVLAAWDESRVTWNTQPISATFGVAASVNATAGYKSWDVTNLVSAWQTGQNYGLVLSKPAHQTTDFDRQFYSRENDKNNPRLVIAYHRPSDSCGGTFMVTQDAYVRSDQPNTSFGSCVQDVNLLRGTGGVPEWRAYFEFDPEALAAALPAGAHIYDAVIELHPRQASAPTPYNFEVWSPSGAWDEETLTWNTQPTLTVGWGSKAYDISFTGFPTTVVQVDVTELAMLWASGAVSVGQIALLPMTDNMNVTFSAKFEECRYGSAAQGPAAAVTWEPARLIVRCTPPAPSAERSSEELDARLMVGLNRLRAASLTTPTIRMDHGAVRFARFQVNLPAGIADDGRTRAQWFTQAYSDVLSLNDPFGDLQMVRRSNDDQHIFFRQRHNGIPVYPAEVAVHLKGDQVTGVSGAYLTEINVDPQPQLSAEQAEGLALTMDRIGAPMSQTLATQSVKAYEFYMPRVAGQTQLRYLNMSLIGSLDDNTYLTWRVNLHNGLIYYIDANSGAARFITTRRVAGFDLDLDTGNHSGPSDSCWYWDFTWDNDDYCDEDGCEAVADAEGRAAFNNIRSTYAWFKGILGYDSYDGAGEEIEMYVHVGNGWQNAHWMGDCEILEFGEGTGNAMDIVAHEFTHGWLDHMIDDGLVYAYEPGALSESFADIFGSFSEHATEFWSPEYAWTIGEALPSYSVSSPGKCGYYRPLGIIRDLETPAACGDPDDVGDMQPWPAVAICNKSDPGYNDCAWVHTNSTVNSKAVSMISDGATHNGYSTVGIGWLKTAHLFHVVVDRLPSNATLLTARDTAEQVALELHNTGYFTAQNVCDVRNAYAAVGLGSGDQDCDGILDNVDPENLDSDGIPDAIDNCPSINNPSQANHDTDSLGDACDPDNDNDGVADGADNCKNVWNPSQGDWDGDGVGDVCDDSDGDGRKDAYDNCRAVANPGWHDLDSDSLGDACDPDIDGDGVLNDADNCRYSANANQLNTDGDVFGNACDKCPNAYSNDASENVDVDNDGYGNVCDADDDGDGVPDDGNASGSPTDHPCSNTLKTNCDDNCRLTPNPTQADYDEDGLGNACDPIDEELLVGSLFVHEVFIRDGEALQQAIKNKPCYACTENALYLDPGYAQRIDVNILAANVIDARFSFTILDSAGRVMRQLTTTPNATGMLAATLGFTPKAYATQYAVGPGVVGLSASSSLAPDAAQYYLQIVPLPGTPVNQVYTFTIQVSDAILLSQVSIDGPDTGHPDTSYTFTSAIAPTNATQPITYTWQPSPVSGQTTGSATYQWPIAGVYTVSLTASNGWGRPITATHVITIEAASPKYSVYLPVILKNMYSTFTAP